MAYMKFFYVMNYFYLVYQIKVFPADGASEHGTANFSASYSFRKMAFSVKLFSSSGAILFEPKDLASRRR